MTHALNAEELRLVHSGALREAVFAYRDRTGVSLIEAGEIVRAEVLLKACIPGGC